MRQAPSVARRAVLAIALLIGFYVLALAIVAALLSLPWLEYRFLGRIEGRLGAFALLGAGAILWAILPRRDRFDDPGPALREEDHPRLFEALRGVARATGQAMPAEVFLVPQLNAWVAQRGGVMGFGSRRVMGLGLPLLEALTVRQFLAVLAHEFGHYYGGDTRLGPWIYKTRAAIERTLQHVHRHSGGLLAKPFQWYGNAFVRITHAVSRQQEFSADALAARTVGAAPLIEGLRLLHGSDGAFSTYWSQEVAPVLQLGKRPPIAAGFRQFLSVDQVQTAMQEAVARELAEGEEGPYDTHPCLRDRVAALAKLDAGQADEADPPAITLLESPDRVEAAMIAFMAGPGAPPLEPVTWGDVGERVWMPFWRSQAARHGGRLVGLTPADLPEQAKDLTALADRLGLIPGNVQAGEEHGAEAGWIVGTAVAIALHDRGWQLDAPPGEPATLTRDGWSVQPISLMPRLASGDLGAADWLALVLGSGIADLDLGVAVGHEAGVAPAVERPAWSFIALTYYGLVLNRTYRVIVTERHLCGGRVRGLLSAPPNIGPQHADPEFYVQPKLAGRYVGVDPESDAFLAIDRANFRIPREQIARVERINRRKWGLGGIPSSGRIVLHLHDGRRRELILIGHQDADAIERSLSRPA